MVEHATGTVAFFQAMAPILSPTYSTVAFVYCFAKVHEQELKGEEEGRLTYLWLIVMVLLFMLYGLYTWGVYPTDGCDRLLHDWLLQIVGALTAPPTSMAVMWRWRSRPTALITDTSKVRPYSSLTH